MPRRAIPHPALVGCAFTGEHAPAFGVTRAQLRGPAYRRILRRAYTTAGTPDSRVTTPVRTAFDCLRFVRHPDGIVVADHLLNKGQCTLDELTA
jgi:hypothetical protein